MSQQAFHEHLMKHEDKEHPCTVDLFTNDVILAFDDALRWNKCRMDIEIELTKGIFFLEVVFPSTKAHFDLTHPS